MWAHSKTLSLFKIGSMVQKLFDVEKLHMRHFLHCSFGGNGAFAIFQHRMTFEPLIQFQKRKCFGINSHYANIFLFLTI